MGNSVSSSGLESHRLLLSTLVGAAELNYNDSFWDELFSWSDPLSSSDPLEVEETLLPFCRQLLVHNPITKNFQKLVLHTIELLESPLEFAKSVSVSNAVYLIQLILKHVMETAAPSTLEGLFHFTRLPNLQIHSSGHLNSRLLHVALLYIRNHPPSEKTYLILVELLKLLMTSASTQLYITETLSQPGTNPLLDVLMHDCADLASGTIQTLLQLFISNPELPANCTLFVPPDPEDQGMLRTVSKAAASMLWIPMRTYSMLTRTQTTTNTSGPLADLSLILLLLLCHYPGTAAPVPHHSHDHLPRPIPNSNPYQLALSSLQDIGGGDMEVGFPDGQHAMVDYSQLFMAVSQRLVNEQSSVLLYTLLQQCKMFHEYCLVRTDVEELLLPLMRQLYNARKRAPNHRYMLQIIVLILTQDEAFAYSIHKVLVRSVPFYTERMLINIPLGSLLYVVLLRTASHSFSRIQDLYLPTNTLAALANLAPYVTHIHSHAAQRLINLLNQLIRRHQRLLQLAATQPASSHDHFPAGLPGSSPAAELQIVADFLRMTLEIVNSILSFNLHSNPEMVYALLHRQEVLQPLRGQARFTELLDNLQIVIDFFNRRLEEARQKAVTPQNWDVSFVLQLVQQAAQTWRPDKLKQFPELRFVYEEEASPQDFFVPYVWSLAVSATQDAYIPWNHSTIVLYSPYQPSDESDRMSDISSALELTGLGDTPRAFNHSPMNQAEMHV